MGETQPFQPLTKTDKITVVLYRLGIIFSCLIIAATAFIVVKGEDIANNGLPAVSGLTLNFLLLSLYFSVGLSVFFIHLYVGKFYRMLKKIYYVAVVCLAGAYFIGHGNPVISYLRTPHYPALLLIPLFLCLGFVTAKEAFCFRLFEGYILAIIMPAYVFFYGVGIATTRGITMGFVIVAVLLTFFTVRKVFQPLHFDIGDKSAYQP